MWCSPFTVIYVVHSAKLTERPSFHGGVGLQFLGGIFYTARVFSGDLERSYSNMPAYRKFAGPVGKALGPNQTASA